MFFKSNQNKIGLSNTKPINRNDEPEIEHEDDDEIPSFNGNFSLNDSTSNQVICNKLAANNSFNSEALISEESKNIKTNSNQNVSENKYSSEISTKIIPNNYDGEFSKKSISKKEGISTNEIPPSENDSIFFYEKMKRDKLSSSGYEKEIDDIPSFNDSCLLNDSTNNHINTNKLALINSKNEKVNNDFYDTTRNCEKIFSKESISKQEGISTNEIPPSEEDNIIPFDKNINQKKEKESTRNDKQASGNEWDEIPSFNYYPVNDSTNNQLISNMFSFNISFDSPTFSIQEKNSNTNSIVSSTDNVANKLVENYYKEFSKKLLSYKTETSKNETSTVHNSSISSNEKVYSEKEEKSFHENHKTISETKKILIQKNVLEECSDQNHVACSNISTFSTNNTHALIKNISRDSLPINQNQEKSCDSSKQIYFDQKGKNILKSFNFNLIDDHNLNSENTEIIATNGMKTSNDNTLFSFNDSIEEQSAEAKIENKLVTDEHKLLKNLSINLKTAKNELNNDKLTKIENRNSLDNSDSNQKAIATDNSQFDNNTSFPFDSKIKDEQSLSLYSNKSLESFKIGIKAPILKEFISPTFFKTDKCNSSEDKESNQEALATDNSQNEDNTLNSINEKLETLCSRSIVSSHEQLSKVAMNRNQLKNEQSSKSKESLISHKTFESFKIEIKAPSLKEFDTPVFTDLFKTHDCEQQQFTNGDSSTNNKNSLCILQSTSDINSSKKQEKMITNDYKGYIKSNTIYKAQIKEFDDPVFIRPTGAESLECHSTCSFNSVNKIKTSKEAIDLGKKYKNSDHLMDYKINSPKIYNPIIKQFDDIKFSNIPLPMNSTKKNLFHTPINPYEEILVDYSKHIELQSEKIYNFILDESNQIAEKNDSKKSPNTDYYPKESIDEKLKKITDEPYLNIYSTHKKSQTKETFIQHAHQRSLKPFIKETEILKNFDITQNFLNSNKVPQINNNFSSKINTSSNYVNSGASNRPKRDPVLIAKLKEVINHIEREYPEVFNPRNIPEKIHHTYRKKHLKQHLMRNIKMIGLEEIDPLKYAEKYASELINTSKLPDLDITMWFESYFNNNNNNNVPFRHLAKKSSNISKNGLTNQNNDQFAPLYFPHLQSSAYLNF